MVVKNIMRHEVVWVTPETTIAKVSQLMLEQGVRSVVICSSEKDVLGIVTDTDILSRAIGHCNLYETPVESIMTKDPVTTTPDANVFDIVKTMGEKHFRRMPVLGDDGKIVGIISIGDIAPQLMLQLELLRGSL
jgi:CBS domain-containing protein